VKNLREIQTLVYQLVAGPEGAIAGNGHGPLRRDLTQIIRSNRGLGGDERIDIYANAYFYRLLECLKEEYPATLTVTGSNDFASLTRDYLVWRPPSEPSIFYAGCYLADFLRNHSPSKYPFLAELARLERATLESFHAPDVSILSDEAMRAIPAEQWPTIELRCHPGVEILRGEWRVSEVLSAIERGEKWAEPVRETNEIIVWRRGISVHYRILEVAETAALALVKKGASFAALSEVIATANPSSDPVALIGQLLACWLADEILVRAESYPGVSRALQG
jgi:Putative DNA-binding domain